MIEIAKGLRVAGMLLALAGICATGKPAAAGEFSPAWNSVCGFGRTVTEGCAPVRQRRIVDASKYPWSAIGRLNFAGHRTYLHCTGALISKRIVLTAAHCLFNNITKRWLHPHSIHFLAGYQRSAHTAHSKAARYVISETYDPLSTSHRYDPTTDWALIELQQPVGAVAGYLGWSILDDNGLDKALKAGGKIGLAGYPATRPHVMSLDDNCKNTQFDPAGDLVIHACAAAQGDSGGPIVLLEDGKATIIAVNSGIAEAGGKVIWVATPVANFYKNIVRTTGDSLPLNPPDGRIGNKGTPPAR